MRNRIALVFSLFSLISLVTAGPAAAEDRSTCAQRGHEDRIGACSRLIAKSGGRDAVAFDNRGAEYGDNGDYDRAIADFSEAIRINPNYAIALQHRGSALLRKNELERAIADMTESLRLDANNLNALNERGMAYAAAGDSDRALSDYNTATRINPKFKFAWYNRGRLYAGKGDHARSIAEYSEAIRIDPDYAQAFNNRGLSYQQTGDAERAVADFSEAIRLSPRTTLAYNNRGNLYRIQGRHDRALADFNEALRYDPQYPNALVNRGMVLEKLGDVARARADFSAALAAPPKYENAKWSLDKARERLAVLSDTSIKTPPATTTAVIALPASGSRDKRIALVVGNSAYENVAALANPARDASLVAETLKLTGFDSVTLHTDLRKDALTVALRDFARQAETADWAVVYYAGHGMEVGGVNYLIPIDARIASDRDVSFEAVALDQVMNAAERARRLRLVILDACGDNPFANQMKRTMTLASRSMSRGLAAVEPEAGTLVVYAAKDGEMALDGGRGSNSPFATAFVTNMRKPGLEVRRLFDYVRDDVMEATNRAQKPFSYGSISGRQDFFFVAAK